jgi:hypothetical protein
MLSIIETTIYGNNSLNYFECPRFTKTLLKEHFLTKSIFGCLLSILRYLTILSQSNLHCRWKSKDSCCSHFCAGDSGSPARRLQCFHTGDFRPGTGDSGPRLWGPFSSGVTHPRYGGGDFARKLWQELVSSPETPALATNPGDSGLWTPETPA